MNRFKKLCLSLVVVLVLPFVTLLVGCGATPSNDLTGIVFDTMLYENGVAVFEVDQGIETDLTYKIFPSTATGYKVYFDPINTGTAENSSRFIFEDGKITILKSEFEDVSYKIRVGEYTDTCIIRLKRYPLEIFTSESDIMLNTNDVKVINVMARFSNTTRAIREDEFDFLVETSDETIIHVPNPNYLKIIPIRNSLASAKVKVTLLNKQGEKTNLSFEINVEVVQNIVDSKVIMSGVDYFVKDEDSVEVNYAELAEESGKKVIEFGVYPINKNDVLDQHGHEYTIALQSQTYIKVSEDGKYILIDDAVTNGYKIKISLIYTDLNTTNGSTFVVDIYLTIKK